MSWCMSTVTPTAQEPIKSENSYHDFSEAGRKQARAMGSIQQHGSVPNTYHRAAVEAVLDRDRSPEWIERKLQKQV